MTCDSWFQLNWQSGLGAPLADKVINPGSRSAHCPRRGMGKILWSREGGAKKIVPCGAQERRSHWTTGTRSTSISEGYPLWLAKSATPDSPFARSQFFYSSSRFTSTAWTSFHESGAIPVTFYGNDVDNVRSDKDSEPETYGEGIKKEIQYRRTLYLKTIIFWRGRCPGASVKTPKFDCKEGGFWIRWIRWGRLWQLADFPLDGL